MLLVTFRSVAKPLKSATQKSPRLSGLSAVETLERELLSTRESLQATIEELQTSNEEFKSANEELQSTNEELQSANEEMETSKEELQSLNEELTTVNAEVEAKALELSRANDDILNLFNSTQIATLFLDNQLLIKRYAEPARRIFRLIPSDVGRPLSDLTNQLEHPSLLDDCKAVLQSLRPKAAEVRTRDGHWFLMRIMPYRTADNAVDGVVATFVDIQPVKSTHSSSGLFRSAFQQHPLPMLILDSLGRIQAANTQSLDFLPAAAPDSASLFEHHLAPGSVRRFRSALSKTVRSRSGTEMTVTIQSGMTRGSRCGLQIFALTSNNSGGASVCVLISHPHQTQNSNAHPSPPTRQ
jgi:two-component system CheB/CheR fusion protein